MGAQQKKWKVANLPAVMGSLNHKRVKSALSQLDPETAYGSILEVARSGLRGLLEAARDWEERGWGRVPTSAQDLPRTGLSDQEKRLSIASSLLDAAMQLPDPVLAQRLGLALFAITVSTPRVPRVFLWSFIDRLDPHFTDIEKREEYRRSRHVEWRVQHWACVAEDPEFLQEWLRRSQACARTLEGDTPLHAAALCGLPRSLQALLGNTQEKAAALLKNKTGHTPLHEAIKAGRFDCAKHLLASSDPEAGWPKKNGPHHKPWCALAMVIGQHEEALMLEMVDAGWKPVNTGGVSALGMAADGGLRAAVMRLLPLSDANRNEGDGQNAAMMAARRGRVDCVRVLLRATDAKRTMEQGMLSLNAWFLNWCATRQPPTEKEQWECVDLLAEYAQGTLWELEEAVAQGYLKNLPRLSARLERRALEKTLESKMELKTVDASFVPATAHNGEMNMSKKHSPAPSQAPQASSRRERRL